MSLRIASALVTLVMCGAAARAQPLPVEPLTGRVDIGAQQITFTYHFDHNALADAVLVGDALVALTESGNLLRIATDPLRLLSRSVVAGRATAIARDDTGTVLVGTDDGHVLEIDATSLASSIVATFTGKVVWLGRRDGRLVVVIEPRVPHPAPGEDLDAWARARDLSTASWSVVVADTAGIRTFPFSSSPHPSGFHIDRRDTLWIAGHNGEFGGGVGWMDLSTGDFESRSLETGIFGFLESDRGFDAYGGLSHLGSESSFIATVSEDYTLTRWLASAWEPRPDAVAVHPVAPITDMRFDSDGRVWALSDGWLYRFQRETSIWTRGPRVQGHRLLASEDSPTIFVISSSEGVMRVSGDTVSTLSFGGQLPADALGLWRTPSGLAVLTTPPYGLQITSSWQNAGGVWESQRLCPEEYDDRRTYPGLVVPGATPIASDLAGTIVICAEPPLSRSEWLLRRTTAGQWETLANWTGALISDPIRAPDDSWLAIDGFDGTLSRLVDDSWEPAGTAPELEMHWFRPRSALRSVRLWRNAPDRALYLSMRHGQLLALDRQSDGTWRLTSVDLPDIANVHDADTDDDAVLVAAPAGLFHYRPADGALRGIPAPASDTIVSITRDTTGRLWAVGERVHVSVDEGKRWQVVDLPIVSRSSEMTLVRRLPDSTGAVAIMMSNRGVVVVEP